MPVGTKKTTFADIETYSSPQFTGWHTTYGTPCVNWYYILTNSRNSFRVGCVTNGLQPKVTTRNCLKRWKSNGKIRNWKQSFEYCRKSPCFRQGYTCPSKNACSFCAATGWNQRSSQIAVKRPSIGDYWWTILILNQWTRWAGLIFFVCPIHEKFSTLWHMEPI